jgi:hypothetical protein
MNDANVAVNHDFLHVSWKRFPIVAGTKDRPLTKWRRGGPGEEATSDPVQIAAWEQRWNGCNWGLATGAESGVFVVDTDGFDGWLWFMGKGVPNTYTVKTGNPDAYRLQYYFRIPEGLRVKTSASEIAPYVDVRGDGGMVLAAGSLHPSGLRYTVAEDAPIAEAPAWLLGMVVDMRAPRVAMALGDVAPLTESQKIYGLAIFKSRLSRYAEVPDGSWNNELTSLTFLAGRMVAAGVFTEDEAEEMMMGCPTVEAYYAEKPRVVVANFASGFATGAREPWDGAEAEAEQLERAGFGDAPLPPGASLEPLKRRAEQIAENLRIGEGSDEHRVVEVLTLDQMLERYLYLTDMESVQDLQNPRRIFSLSSFMKAHCASKTEVVVEGEWGPDGSPKVKSYPTAKLWMDSEKLLVAPTVTFRPGAPVLTEDPEGNESANTWRAIERTSPVAGSCELFSQHVDYLFGADASRFLDWLAHIEQEPGVLPHSGWIHVSPMQGTGRNWLASVLCRLWRGYVAPNFDLAGTLSSGFNGRLSHKLLAVVDEIDEGGGEAKWGNAQALKSLITTDTRAINPKYGHQRLEWNACRWLIFSNHTSALPLTEADRRFNVVRNEQPPMPDGYYGKLYASLKDSAFIESVAWMLKTRDIAGFNPGAHAAMTEAKRDMIGASKSDADDIVAYLVAEHPADVITNAALAQLLTSNQFGTLTAHHRHALDRAGTAAYGKALKIRGKVMKVRVLRNHQFWKNAESWQIQAELNKGSVASPPMPFEQFVATRTVQ